MTAPAPGLRVLLDTSFARRGPSGTAVYTEQLARALRGEGVEVLEVADEGRGRPGGGRWASVAHALRDERWRRRELPRRARELGADLIHHPLPAHSPGVRQVITVHDLAFQTAPELFAPSFRRYARLAHRSAARRADAVVCVSHATAEDVRARWGVSRLVVAHHGPGQLADPPAARPEGGGEHLLYVGDDEPRKNLGLLLEGYRRYRARCAAPLPLVLAGRAQDAGEGVRSDPAPDVPQLLADAVALVHPALVEGFGLTPLEAMASGVPVLAVRSPAVAEVCGEAARWIDPHDPDSLAGELLALDPPRRAQMAAAGRRRAAAFSWRASARAHIEAYTLALSER